MAGFTFGADYRLQDNLIVGLATGSSYTKANNSRDLDASLSSGGSTFTL